MEQMNKKGWLRIVEATLAIMIVLGVLIALNSNRPAVTQNDLTQSINPILEEIASNTSLRENILLNDPKEAVDMIDSILKNRITNPSLKYSFRICSLDDVCGMENFPTGAGEIYSQERIITSTLDNYNPKKVKIFIWRTG